MTQIKVRMANYYKLPELHYDMTDEAGCSQMVDIISTVVKVGAMHERCSYMAETQLKI